MGLLNGAMALYIGWEVGKWLNTFTVTQNLATIAVGEYEKAIERASYRLEYLYNVVTLNWGALKALTEAHNKAQQGYDDLTMSIVASNEAAGNTVELTGDQQAALEALRTPQQVFIDDTKQLGILFNANKISLDAYIIGLNRMKEALDQANAAAASAKLSEAEKAIAKLQDKYNKLTMSTEDYNAAQALTLEGTDEQRAKFTELANAVDKLEAGKKELTKTTKDYAAEAKKAAKEEEDFWRKSLGFLQGQAEQLRLLKLTGKERELETKISSDLNSVLGELYDSTKVYTEAKSALIAEVMHNTTAIFAETEAKAKQTAGLEAGKSAMDAQIDRYQRLTMSAEEYLYTQLLLKGVSPGTAIEVVALSNEIDTFEKTRKSAEKYHKLIQDITNSTERLGATNSAVFDGALGGVNTLVGVFRDMGDELSKTTKQQELLNDAYARESANINNDAKLDDRQKYTLMLGIEGDYLKANKKLASDKTNAELTGARQIIGATAKLFDEKSKAAKSLHAVEMGIAVAQMVMQGVQMAKTIAVTAVDMAAGAAKFFAQSGWAGFAGVAAMGAVMAGLGYAAFSGGGGSSEPPRVASDTGTVLGDATAVSNSINSTHDLLKEIHASEYRELRGINFGVASLSSGITDVVTRLFQGGGLKDFAQVPGSKNTGYGMMGNAIQWGAMLGSGGLAKFDPIANKILGFLFGGKQTSEIVGSGIKIGETLINSIVDGASLAASQYATIKTTTKGGLFGKTKTGFSEQTGALDDAVQKSLDNVFRAMGESMLEIAEKLGFDTKAKVEAYIIPAMNIELKDLSGEDAAKKINGVISTILDAMSTEVFGDIVGEHQKLGEGMMETASRIVIQIGIIRESLAITGKGIDGDVIKITNSLSELTGGIQEFQSKFEEAWDTFATDAEKQARRLDTLNMKSEGIFSPDDMKKLLESRDGFREIYAALGDINAENIDRVAYLLNETKALDDYYDGLEDAAKAFNDAVNLFATAAQKHAALGNQLYAALSPAFSDDLIIRMAEGGVKGIVDLYHELGALGEEGKALQQILIDNARGIYDFASAVDATINKRNEMELALMEAQGKSAEVLAIKRINEIKAMDASLRPLQMMINAENDLKAARDKSMAALERLSSLEVQLLREQGDEEGALMLERSKILADIDKEIDKTTKELENAVKVMNGIKSGNDALQSETMQLKNATFDLTDAIIDLTNEIVAKNTPQTANIVTAATMNVSDAAANAPIYDGPQYIAPTVAAAGFTTEQIRDYVMANAATGDYMATYLKAIEVGIGSAVLEGIMGWEAGFIDKWTEAAGVADLPTNNVITENTNTTPAIISTMEETVKTLGETVDTLKDTKQTQIDLWETQDAKKIRETVDKEAERIASERKGIQDQINQLTLKSSELLALQRAELHESNRELFDTLQSIIKTNLMRGLEIELLNAQGRSHEALLMSREDEIKLMDGDVAARKREIFAAIDAAKTRGLEIQLMEALDDATGALAATREIELRALSEVDKALQLSIWAALDAKKAEEELAAARNKTVDEAKAATDMAYKVLQKAVEAERKLITDAYNANVESTQATIDSLSDSVGKLSSIAGKLKSTLDGMANPADSGMIGRMVAQAVIRSSLELARTGQGFGDEEALTKALGVVSEPSEGLFGNFVDYQRDFLRTSIDISALSFIADEQLTTEELLLKTAKDSLETLKATYDGEMTRLDGILENAQAQIDAVNGVTVAVMTIHDALNNLAAALSTQKPAQAAVKMAEVASYAGTPTASVPTGSRSYVDAESGMTQLSGNTNPMATAELAANIATSWANAAGDPVMESAVKNFMTQLELTQAQLGLALPGFAVGINEVPYDMVANIHKGERILPAADNRELMMHLSQPRREGQNNAELIAEIKALRAEVRAGQAAIVSETKGTNRILRDVTQDGTAVTTVAQV
ncbi:MAG: hypothetical protein Q7U38_11880 [Methylobacter sp.]|nr:hypothetical protein [Methylobacter sp.]